MSETYFISGAVQPAGTPLDTLLQAIYSSAGIKPKQVDEIHLFSDAASALFQRRLDTVFGPVVHWPLIPFLPANTLFSDCRALESSELSTCILAESSSSVSCAFLLANPNAIGRFNLSPQAQFSIRCSYPEGINNFEAVAQKALAAMPKEDPDPENETPDLRIPPKHDARPWLAVHAPEKPSTIIWPEDRLTYSPSMVHGLLMLINAMNQTKTDPGIWVSVSGNEPACSLLALPL